LFFINISPNSRKALIHQPNGMRGIKNEYVTLLNMDSMHFIVKI
jgi:hypothetical protein